MDRGLNETARKFPENRPDYCQKRIWSGRGSNETRQPKFSFVGPDWMMPRKLLEMMATRTTTIWGTAGRMSDVEVPA
jgi:hypothetical protein